MMLSIFGASRNRTITQSVPLGNIARHRSCWIVLLMVTLLALSASQALASGGSYYGQVVYWQGGSTGTWSNPYNWSSYPVVPNNGNRGCYFDVAINGTANIDSPVEVRNCTMYYGGIKGGDLTVEGILTLAGSMEGPGTTYALGGIVIDGSFVTLSRRLNNLATATWTGAGDIYLLSNTGELNNSGIFEVRNDSSIYSFGGTAAVNNSGIFRKLASTGTSYFDTTFNNTGTIEAQTGTMYFAGAFTQTSGVISILPGATVTAAGTFVANKVVNNGAFLALGPTTIGDLNSYGGYSGTGSLRVESSLLGINSAGFVALNGPTSLAGGTIAAPNGLTFGSGANLAGFGSVNAKIAAAFGSTIRAEGNLVLGDSSSYAGFTSDGELYTGHSVVTINDRNVAVLGSLTQLGDNDGPGTLTAGNARSTDSYAHFLLEQGKNLVGTGYVNGNFKNQGDVIGDGAAMNQRIVFNSPWVVSGKGTFTNTLILGTFAPGESPAISNGTNQAFAGTVQIELGGTTPGFDSSNHDQINDSAAIVLLDSSTLSLLPWNSFIPAAGDEFTVITWQTGLNGTFSSLDVDPWFTNHGISFTLQYNNVAGAGSLMAVAVATPEPGTFVLLAVGALGLLLVRWHRNPRS